MYNFRRHYINQVDEADCGVAALAMILHNYGSKISLATLRKFTKTTTDGTTALGIVKAAEKLKMDVEAYQADTSLFDSKDVIYPFIAHLIKKDSGLLHYCVVFKSSKKHIFIIQVKRIPKVNFFEEWTGIAIFAKPGKNYKAIQEKIPTFKRLCRPLFQQKSLLCGIITAAFIVTFLNILNSYYLQTLLDTLIPNKLQDPLAIISIGLLFAYLFNTLFTFSRDYLLAILGQKLPMAFFSTRKTGDILSRFTDANKVIDALVSSIISIFLDATILIIIGTVLALQDIRLFGITMLVIPIYSLLIFSFTSNFRKLNQKEMESNATVSASIIEDIRGIETIKSLNCEEVRSNKITNEFNDFLHKSLVHTRLNNIQQGLKTFVQLSLNLIILWVGANQVIKNELSIGQLMTYNALLVYFTTSLQNIINLQPKIQSAQVANNRLNEIYMVKDEFENTTKHNHSLKNGTIELKNVSYSYEYNSPILQNINLKIKSGEKMTIVGLSGSGKSTLMKLLVNYFDVSNGEILINNLNILNISKKQLRSFINYVPQIPYTFSGTIKENLLLGNRTTITEKDIVTACKTAMIHDDIMHLPLGYDSKLDENAATFSGGQKQRLTIARALLSPAKVLIFDESTSGLDVLTEEKLIKNLMALSSKTIIFIAHRLSIARITNNITVIDNGKIIERGSHEELLKNKSLYFNLMQTQ